MPATDNDHDAGTGSHRKADAWRLTISVGMYESRSNSDLLPFYVAPGHPDTTLRASLELIEDAEQQDDSATDTVELAYSSYKIRLTGKDGLQLLNAELSEEDFPDAGVHDFWLGQESLGLRQHLTVSNSPFKLELLITLLDNSIIHAETCFKVEVGKIQVLLGNVDDLTYPTPDRPVPTRNPTQDALENRKYAYTLWHNEEYRRRNNALIQTLRQQVSKELGQAYPDSAPLPLKPYSKADSQLVLQLAGNCFMTGYAEMYDNTGFRSYQDLWTYKTALAGPWKQGPMIPLYAQPLLRCSGLEHQYCVDVEAVRGLVLNWTWQTGITVSPDPNLPDAIKAALDKAYTTSGEHPRRRADTSPIFGGQRYRCPLMQLSGQQPPATELNAVGMAKLDGLSSVLNGALRLVPIDLINDGKVAQTRLDESGYSRILMYGPVISKDSICLRLGLAHDDSEVSTLDSYCFSSMRTVTVHNHMFREGGKFYRTQLHPNVSDELKRLFSKAGITLTFPDEFEVKVDPHFQLAYKNALVKLLQRKGPLKEHLVFLLKSKENSTINIAGIQDRDKGDLYKKYRNELIAEQIKKHTMCLIFEQRLDYRNRVAQFLNIGTENADFLDPLLPEAKTDLAYKTICDNIAQMFEAQVAQEYLNQLHANDPVGASGLHIFTYNFAHNLTDSLLGVGIGIASGYAAMPQACPACNTPKPSKTYPFSLTPADQTCDCGYELRNIASITLTFPEALFSSESSGTSIQAQLAKLGLTQFAKKHPQLNDTMGETLAHELGHSLFLPHAPFPTTPPEMQPAGGAAHLHQSDDPLCIMSYTNFKAEQYRYKHFCAICTLRLRGWSGGKPLDIDDDWKWIERTAFAEQPDLLTQIREQRKKRNLVYSTPTRSGFNQTDSTP